MKITVIVPVMNAERFIADALSSIAAQTNPASEVLVIDGPSTDATQEIVSRFPMAQYLRQPGVGMWNALNYGISVAGGDAIAFLSSDDLWHPDKLHLQNAWLEQHPEPLIVFSHVTFVELSDGSPLAKSKPNIFDRPVPAYLTECLLARRKLFDILGPFPEEYAIASDMDWFARMLDAKIPYHMLNEVLLTKRFHGSNLSTTASSGVRYNRELLEIMRSKIVRGKSQKHER